MKQYAQRGTALSLAVLLLAGSAQALFGRGKEKTEPVGAGKCAGSTGFGNSDLSRHSVSGTSGGNCS